MRQALVVMRGRFKSKRTNKFTDLVAPIFGDASRTPNAMRACFMGHSRTEAWETDIATDALHGLLTCMCCAAPRFNPFCVERVYSLSSKSSHGLPLCGSDLKLEEIQEI
jgi:hypothetical protein